MPTNDFLRIVELEPHLEEISLHLASLVDGDVPTYQRVQVTETVLADFRNATAGNLQTIKEAYEEGDLELLPYDGGTKPDKHEIEYLRLPDHQVVYDQLRSLRNNEVLLPLFQAEEAFVKCLRFYVIGLHTTAEGGVFFLRWYSKKKELNRSKGFGAWFKNGQFNKVEEPLFLFDEKVDCVVSGDYLFVLNKAMFHRIFRFLERVKASARENLDRIQRLVPIENFEGFCDSCLRHTQKMYKLNVIASKPYLDKVTIDDLIATIEHHELDIAIVGEGDQRQLVYDDRNRWGLLKLLDDDYLESRMTGNLYESNSKRTTPATGS